MEMDANVFIEDMTYNNLDKIMEDIVSGKLNKIKIVSDSRYKTVLLLIGNPLTIDDPSASDGSTLMIKLSRDDALFLGQALVAMNT